MCIMLLQFSKFSSWDNIIWCKLMATDVKSDETVAVADSTLQVTVCGGGNGAHAFVLSLASSFSPHFKVNWLSLYADEADRINQGLSKNNGFLEGHFKQENVVIRHGGSINVSKDGSKLIPNSDICLLCVPAFAHRYYLDAIRKYHEICNNKNSKRNLLVVGFPCSSGLDIEFASKLGQFKDQIGLFCCRTLPWACRIRLVSPCFF